MKHIKLFEGIDLIALESRIGDVISNNVEIRDVPYSYHVCSECGEMSKEVDSRTVELAAKSIIELLQKEGII